MLSIIKIYNFRVDFTDCFTATVEFEKNYDLFNLKFSCIKEKQIFADAAAVTACTANYRPDPFDLLNANIEALAQDESLDPGESYSGTYEISVICTRCGATLIRCMPGYEPCPSTCTPTIHSC